MDWNWNHSYRRIQLHQAGFAVDGNLVIKPSKTTLIWSVWTCVDWTTGTCYCMFGRRMKRQSRKFQFVRVIYSKVQTKLGLRPGVPPSSTISPLNDPRCFIHQEKDEKYLLYHSLSFHKMGMMLCVGLEACKSIFPPCSSCSGSKKRGKDLKWALFQLQNDFKKAESWFLELYDHRKPQFSVDRLNLL